MPRLAVKSDLVPLNMKVTRELRAQLEEAAKKSGRSLTGEVGYRVERLAEAEAEIGRLSAYKRAQAEDIMSLGQVIGKLEAEIGRLRDEHPVAP